jgi:tRNA(fMet)-specific endonuclease VapC
MYLLDTNTLIYYFKGKGKVAVRLLQVAPREVAVSTITVYELEVGLAKTNARVCGAPSSKTSLPS